MPRHRVTRDARKLQPFMANVSGNVVHDALAAGEGSGIDVVNSVIGLGLDSILIARAGGAPATEYVTLAGACASAVSGEVIWIAKTGTVAESVTIPVGVTLAGIDQERCVISGVVTLSDGSALSNLSIQRAANDTTRLVGIVAPETGAADLRHVTVLVDQAGGGDSWCISVPGSGKLRCYGSSLSASAGGSAYLGVCAEGASGTLALWDCQVEAADGLWAQFSAYDGWYWRAPSPAPSSTCNALYPSSGYNPDQWGPMASAPYAANLYAYVIQQTSDDSTWAWKRTGTDTDYMLIDEQGGGPWRVIIASDVPGDLLAGRSAALAAKYPGVGVITGTVGSEWTNQRRGFRAGAPWHQGAQSGYMVNSTLIDTLYYGSGEGEYTPLTDGLTTYSVQIAQGAGMGEPMEGDLGVWDALNYQARHANDIDDPAGIHHTLDSLDARYQPATVADTATIDLTLTGQQISADLKNTTVTPGSYTNADITVDATGRITAASDGLSSGRYRQFVYEVSSGDFSFVIDQDGSPVLALQELE